MSSSENMDLWKQLAKTDPDQVTGFKRAGGFGGHAVKPIYVVQKMTQIFGPCGVGWIIDKPEFTTVPTDDGLISVHCTVMVQVRIPGTDELTAPIPGVGGDFAVAQRKSGKFADDEAFKKAYTDAIGNALKFLGMSADIHMGRFEDSKYVNGLREDKQAARNGRAKSKPKGGGYQNRYVKPQPANEQSGDDEPPPHIDEPPLCDPADVPDHDPDTGEIIEDVVVRYSDDTEEGAATAAEAATMLAERIKKVRLFEAEKMMGANMEWIQALPRRLQDRLEEIINEKNAAAENETRQMGVAS